MQITIQIPDDLKQHLIHRSNQLNISLETFILQSLRQFSQIPPNQVTSQAHLERTILFFLRRNAP